MALTRTATPYPPPPGAAKQAEQENTEISLTEAQLAEALGVNTALADRLFPVAVALVERYAPDAPDSIKSEAVIRTAGWMAEQPMAAIRDETTGDIRTGYAVNNTNALRHSGSMSLLAPWRVYRAGVIG